MMETRSSKKRKAVESLEDDPDTDMSVSVAHSPETSADSIDDEGEETSADSIDDEGEESEEEEEYSMDPNFPEVRK